MVSSSLLNRLRTHVNTARAFAASRVAPADLALVRVVDEPTIAEPLTALPEVPLDESVVIKSVSDPKPDLSLSHEDRTWVAAHRSVGEPDIAPATAVVYASQAVQEYFAEVLRTLDWDVTEPVLFTEGWVSARGERTETGQPVTTYATPSKSSAAFSRNSDSKTSRAAGDKAAANQSVTVNSHQGRLLAVFDRQHTTSPGVGYTAAEAVSAAGLLTDGMHGSPWHRVTDLRDMGLLAFLLDDTMERSTRKNGSNSEADVLVITPKGRNVAYALTRLAAAGYRDYPIDFEGHADATLFEDLPATLARIDDLPEPPAA